MIVSLTGKVVEYMPPMVVLEVGGIGYEVQLTLPDGALVTQAGADQLIKLYVQQIIREDAHLLFGFLRREQREWFRLLIKVNGLGPKLAMAVLSAMQPLELMECVCSENCKALTKIPGVGNKVAQRMVVELKDKLKNYGGGSLIDGGELAAVSASGELFGELGFFGAMAATATGGNKDMQEAVSALINLGYKPQQAQQMVSKIENADQKKCEDLIREALKMSAAPTPSSRQ